MLRKVIYILRNMPYLEKSSDLNSAHVPLKQYSIFITVDDSLIPTSKIDTVTHWCTWLSEFQLNILSLFVNPSLCWHLNGTYLSLYLLPLEEGSRLCKENFTDHWKFSNCWVNLPENGDTIMIFRDSWNCYVCSLNHVEDMSNIIWNFVFCPQKAFWKRRREYRYTSTTASFGLPTHLNDIGSKLLF